MANIPIYDGNPIWDASKTPFGFYDNDVDFQTDALKVARFVASRLGYPLMDVELQDANIFTAFEEAVTVYGNELYAYKVRDNQLSLEGTDPNVSLNNTIVTPTMESVIKLSKKYGTEAEVGGKIDIKMGLVDIVPDVQNYDLDAWATSQNIVGDIEIKRVFQVMPAAINRYFDPYSGTGFGFQGLFSSFGFGNMSPAINYLVMPLSYDMQTLQAIEMNDQIRRSNYSFELRNNKLTIFPIPSSECKLRIEYIEVNDRINSGIETDSNGDPITNVVSNVSNSPYTNPTYSTINSIGRSWIFEYTLALSKEMLGLIRGKYNSIPIPNAEVQLNQSDLLTQALEEKNKLVDRLREYFDETSRKALLERKAQESEYANSELKHVPLKIYVG